MTGTQQSTQNSAQRQSVSEHTLSASTGMGAVTLNVGNLERMSSYYEQALMLEPIEEAEHGGRRRVLGRGRTPMVQLVETPGLPAWTPQQAGLFHTAFLFDTQADLAVTVARAAQHPESRYVGSADHLVSEAFYFTDPEGNGIELYWDRDRSTWQHMGNEVVMDSLYIDANAYLNQHITEAALKAGPSAAGRVGHVHLQVGDIARAKAFYVDQIGFEVSNSMTPTALFAATGGYHHHVAMNIWNSRGAGPRAATLGLGNLRIEVPGRSDLDALASRLTSAKTQFADDGASLVVNDPWGTKVTVAVPGADAETLLGQ